MGYNTSVRSASTVSVGCAVRVGEWSVRNTVTVAGSMPRHVAMLVDHERSWMVNSTKLERSAQSGFVTGEQAHGSGLMQRAEEDQPEEAYEAQLIRLDQVAAESLLKLIEK